MKVALLAVVLCSLLAGAIYAAAMVWTGLAESEISTNGMIALGLGVLCTLALGAGLMALVFYSSRHGHDDDHY
jgi:hypothetical protein